MWASPPALPRHRSPRRLQSLRSVSRLAGVLSKRFPSLTMAVIPQNPLLMEGPIRFNLDPFGEHSGDKLLEIL